MVCPSLIGIRLVTWGWVSWVRVQSLVYREGIFYFLAGRSYWVVFVISEGLTVEGSCLESISREVVSWLIVWTIGSIDSWIFLSSLITWESRGTIVSMVLR